MAGKTLVLGVSGQDGSYLAQLLVAKGFEVVGTTRGESFNGLDNLTKLGVSDRIQVRTIVPSSFTQVSELLSEIRPDVIYNLLGPSSVSYSYHHPGETLRIIQEQTINCLESIRSGNKKIKYYNACSSECFGDTYGVPADEDTPFRPISPYAVAKSSTHWITRHYREIYGLFACSGMLFNHESPLRSKQFVTQKIISGAVDVVRNKANSISLGNIDIVRDWGWAPEYVEGMYRIMDVDEPEDFVLATGRAHTLQEFAALVFEKLNLNWQEHVKQSKDLLRPADIPYSVGNPKKAQEKLGWVATKDLSYIVDRMLDEYLSVR